jgi:hypothetical protein
MHWCDFQVEVQLNTGWCSDLLLSFLEPHFPFSEENEFFFLSAHFLDVTELYSVLGLQSGVPRTGYRGVVSFLYKGRRVYLAPSVNWKGYDPGWS